MKEVGRENSWGSKTCSKENDWQEKKGKRNEPKKIKKLEEKRNRLSREWREAQKSRV